MREPWFLDNIHVTADDLRQLPPQLLQPAEVVEAASREPQGSRMRSLR